MATHTINQNQLRPSGSFIFPDMANSDRMPKRRGNSKLSSQRAKDNSKLTILVLKLRNLTDMFDVFISHSWKGSGFATHRYLVLVSRDL